jgi:chromosome segregation ATPase
MSIPDCLKGHLKQTPNDELKKLKSISDSAIRELYQREELIRSAAECIEQQNNLIRHITQERDELHTNIDEILKEKIQSLDTMPNTQALSRLDELQEKIESLSKTHINEHQSQKKAITPKPRKLKAKTLKPSKTRWR